MSVCYCLSRFRSFLVGYPQGHHHPVPLLATGAYRPRGIISGDACSVLLQKAPYFPLQAVP